MPKNKEDKPGWQKLPPNRPGRSRSLTTVEGAATIGYYPDGTVGEIFIHTHKQSPELTEAVREYCLMLSSLLQHGVSLGFIVTCFRDLEQEWGAKPAERSLMAQIMEEVFHWLEESLENSPPQLQLLPSKDTRQLPLPDLNCPDCGEALHFAEGCLVCRACGYNKCG